MVNASRTIRYARAPRFSASSTATGSNPAPVAAARNVSACAVVTTPSRAKRFRCSVARSRCDALS
eukprot:30756-Pelagococcus_subviridis.AAC.3